jgi:hypothetical protein
MGLKIISIHNHGDAKEEFIQLRATADIDLGSYAVVDRTFKGEQVSNVHRHYFRFPAKLIKNGDYVVLRTSPGKPQVDKMKDGETPLYRFFWGSNAPIWNDANTEQAELLKVATVEYKDVTKVAAA